MWLPKWIKNAIVNTCIEIAEDKIGKYLTVDCITKYILDAVNGAIEKAASANGVSDKALAKICKGCAIGGRVLTGLSEALNPNGPGGKSVTEDEASTILNDAATACGCVLTQEWIDSKKSDFFKQVKVKLGDE